MKGTSAHVALELTHVEPVDQRSGTRKADGVWHFWERAGQRHDALKRVAQTPECRLLFLVGVKHVPNEHMGIGVCGLHKHNPLVWCMRVSMVGEAVGARGASWGGP